MTGVTFYDGGKVLGGGETQVEGDVGHGVLGFAEPAHGFGDAGAEDVFSGRDAVLGFKTGLEAGDGETGLRGEARERQWFV